MRVAAAGPQLAFVWQTQHTEYAGGASVRVGAARAAATFRVACSAHKIS